MSVSSLALPPLLSSSPSPLTNKSRQTEECGATTNQGWQFAPDGTLRLLNTGILTHRVLPLVLLPSLLFSLSLFLLFFFFFFFFFIFFFDYKALCLEVNGTDPTSGSPSVRTMPCNNKLQSQIWKYSGTTIVSAVKGDCLVTPPSLPSQLSLPSPFLSS